MHRKSSVFAIALVAAALAAPSAVAAATQHPALADAHAHSADLRSPDARDAAERYGIYGSDATHVQDLRSPDARDVADGIVPSAQSVRVVRVVDTAPAGFSWGDAAVGAAASLGLVLLVGGAVIGISRRRLRTA
jgi:uncharacterized iron-regulated membrane protein